MKSVVQFVVVLGSGIEIFLVWLVGCVPIFRVKWLSVCMEGAWEAGLAFARSVC